MYSLFDAHCDTITELYEKGEELIKNNRQVSISRLLSFNMPVQVFAVWLDKKHKGKYFEKTMEVIDFYYSQLEKYADYITHVNNCTEITENKKTHKISAALAIEGGEALEGKIESIEKFYERGVRILTLTWNNKNELGDGVGVDDAEGLTEFGVKVVEKMNGLGMLTDVSHLSQKGFWDVMEISKKAVIASHSNAFSVCGHKRNLSDEQIKKIADSGGVVGINMYPPHLAENGQARIMDIIKHIDHMVKLAGTECVGFGCDFDGIEKTPDGIYNVESINRLAYIIELMYGCETAEKIMYKNFLRVFCDVC